MYSEKLENLITHALADGVLTDKKKQILFRNAEAEGIELDEFEMVLDARLYERQQTAKPVSQSPVEVSPSIPQVQENNRQEITVEEKYEKEIERIITTNLKKKESRFLFYKDIPAGKKSNAKSTYVKLDKGEKIICLHILENICFSSKAFYWESIGGVFSGEGNNNSIEYKNIKICFSINNILYINDLSFSLLGEGKERIKKTLTEILLYSKSIEEIENEAMTFFQDIKLQFKEFQASEKRKDSDENPIIKLGKNALGLQGLQDYKHAKNIKEACGNVYEAAQQVTELKRISLDNIVNAFGELRLDMLHQTIGRFLEYLKAMNQKNMIKEYEILDGIGLDTKSIKQMQTLDMSATRSLALYGLIEVGGVATLAAGWMTSIFYAKKLTEAKEYEKQVSIAVTEIEKAWVGMDAIGQRTKEVSNVTQELAIRCTQQLDLLEPLVPIFDFNQTPHVQIFQSCGLLVKSMAELAATPLLDDQGNLTSQSLQIIGKTRSILNTQLINHG